MQSLCLQYFKCTTLSLMYKFIFRTCTMYITTLWYTRFFNRIKNTLKQLLTNTGNTWNPTGYRTFIGKSWKRVPTMARR